MEHPADLSDLSELSMPVSTYTELVTKYPEIKDIFMKKARESSQEYTAFKHAQMAERPPQQPPVQYVTTPTPIKRTIAHAASPTAPVHEPAVSHRPDPVYGPTRSQPVSTHPVITHAAPAQQSLAQSTTTRPTVQQPVSFAIAPQPATVEPTAVSPRLTQAPAMIPAPDPFVNPSLLQGSVSMTARTSKIPPGESDAAFVAEQARLQAQERWFSAGVAWHKSLMQMSAMEVRIRGAEAELEALGLQPDTRRLMEFIVAQNK